MASPLFLNHITATILIILQASANILIIPDVKRFSTVSASPTNLDTTVPGSWLVRPLVVRQLYLSINALLNECAIFCPNTVRNVSLVLSIIPVIRRNPKYIIII